MGKQRDSRADCTMIRGHWRRRERARWGQRSVRGPNCETSPSIGKNSTGERPDLVPRIILSQHGCARARVRSRATKIRVKSSPLPIMGYVVPDLRAPLSSDPPFPQSLTVATERSSNTMLARRIRKEKQLLFNPPIKYS